MTVSREVVQLLRDIVDGQHDRSSLAEWLAEYSLRFYQSLNELDRMIVADLDAALGEIQRTNRGHEILVETPTQLVNGLGPVLPDGSHCHRPSRVSGDDVDKLSQ